jgi:hypothetical protein
VINLTAPPAVNREGRCPLEPKKARRAPQAADRIGGGDIGTSHSGGWRWPWRQTQLDVSDEADSNVVFEIESHNPVGRSTEPAEGSTRCAPHLTRSPEPSRALPRGVTTSADSDEPPRQPRQGDVDANGLSIVVTDIFVVITDIAIIYVAFQRGGIAGCIRVVRKYAAFFAGFETASLAPALHNPSRIERPH